MPGPSWCAQEVLDVNFARTLVNKVHSRCLQPYTVFQYVLGGGDPQALSSLSIILEGSKRVVRVLGLKLL